MPRRVRAPAASDVDKGQTEARFGPLFNVAWREAYPSLSLLMNKKCTGPEAAKIVQTLASMIDTSREFSNAAVTALDVTVKGLLPTIKSEAMDNSSNSDRAAAIAAINAASAAAAVAASASAISATAVSAAIAT